jgi:histidinol-phosphate aminotransferase
MTSDGTRSKADVRSLVRPHILEMPGYEPVEPVDVMARRLGLRIDQIAKLDGNENPYGPSPKVAERLARFEHYHIYPDPAQRAVREAIGDYIGVDAEQIVLGSGSDELLHQAAMLFLSPGDAMVSCPPTFGMYDFMGRLYDARLVEVPRNEDFTIDIASLEEALHRGAKLLYLASPNNPTGNPLPREQLLRLLEYSVALVIDEAYAEFAGESAVDLVDDYDNLIVVRTFSKWAGLAGLRAGYSVVPSSLVEVVWKAKIPYNLSVASEQGILASLEDQKVLRERVRLIVEERERMFDQLARLPFVRPFPSSGNFILTEVRGVEARAVRDELRHQGILIRYFDAPGLRNCVRISVGRQHDTDRVIEALDEIGAGLGH